MELAKKLRRKSPEVKKKPPTSEQRTSPASRETNTSSSITAAQASPRRSSMTLWEEFDVLRNKQKEVRRSIVNASRAARIKPYMDQYLQMEENFMDFANSVMTVYSKDNHALLKIGQLKYEIQQESKKILALWDKKLQSAKSITFNETVQVRHIPAFVSSTLDEPDENEKKDDPGTDFGQSNSGQSGTPETPPEEKDNEETAKTKPDQISGDLKLPEPSAEKFLSMPSLLDSSCWDKSEKERERMERAERKKRKERMKLEYEFVKNGIETERLLRQHEEEKRQIEEKLKLLELQQELGNMSSSDESSNKDFERLSSDEDIANSQKASSLYVDIPEVSPSAASTKHTTSSHVHYSQLEKNVEDATVDDRIREPKMRDRRHGAIPHDALADDSDSNDDAHGLQYAATAPVQRQIECIDNQPSFAPFRNFRTTTYDRALPKLKLHDFSGDPLEWPEWSGMFQSTIGNSRISDDEKMAHLKSHLTGAAKRAVMGMGYSGHMFNNAWKTLERKFGQPHLIVSSQLSKIQSYPPIKLNESNAFVGFADAVSNFVSILQQFGYSNDLFSSSNLETVVRKLPSDIRRRWFAHIEQPNRRNKLASLMDLNIWLQEEALVQDRLASSFGKTNLTDSEQNRWKSNGRARQAKEQTLSFNATANAKSNTCCLGDGSHPIWKCEKFKTMKTDQRLKTVKDNKLCFSCLSNKHQIRNCDRKRKCNVDGCLKEHNRLLHMPPQPIREEVLESTQTQLSSTSRVAMRGLLPVAPIRIFGSGGSYQDTMALCDSGSSQTWVDEDLLHQIGSTGSKSTITVSGIHGTSPIETTKVEVKIGPAGSEKVNCDTFIANSHRNLNAGNAVYRIQEMLEKYPYLKCINRTTIDLRDVKVILGQDAFSLIRPLEYQHSGSKSPWAVRLPLGWTLSGPMPARELDSSFQSCQFSEDKALADEIRRWWDLESYGTTISCDARSAEDKKALTLLEESVQLKNGRYSVSMLWNEKKNVLQNNFVPALGQLKSLEKRLYNDPKLRERYQATINSDERKGYIEVVPDGNVTTKWYTPHHPVLNPNKPEKVRRVCNAASKFGGLCLNDALMTGPDLLSNLMGIVFRFREKPVAVTADIEEMFLQIEVPENDRQYLRFLWRDQEGQLITYQYNRHIFGAKSSPTCANFALQRCARDNDADFPVPAALVKDHFYMDDLLLSLEDTEKMKTMISEMTSLLAKGGFKLTKWVSNVEDITKLVATENETKKTPVVLGLEWDNHSDTLTVCRGISLELKEQWSHRNILSAVSAIFDPLGFLAPFVIRGRLILKQIWQRHGQQWDTPVDDDISQQFSDWASELTSDLRIILPRWYSMNEDDTVELHAFGDASEEAYCAAIYLVVQKADTGERLTNFVIGKSRVAPMKHHTIPKLELMAAVAATRLKLLVVNEHKRQFDKIYMWTDSTTVLQWIRNSANKQQTFVANRCAEILDSCTVDQWHHVAGKDNPADLGTRGLSYENLAQSDWIRGPSWLQRPIHLQDNANNDSVVEAEEFIATETCTNQPRIIDWSRYGTFRKLRNTIARIWMWREHEREFTVDNLAKSEETIFRQVQRECFPEDIKALEKNKLLSPKSPLVQLAPFLSDGLIRAKGRLRKANLQFSSKHPIILPSKHRAVQLYLEEIHRQYNHQGVEFLRSIVQQRFWILGLRNALRSIRHDCVRCRMTNNTFSPPMSDLPSVRVEDSIRPFTNTGVDYFGPLLVKSFRRTVKRWICLFTCLNVRAVHLEVVSSLDTDSCLDAMHRFIARRGKPKTIVSDNGTNFVGACNELRAAFKSLDSGAIQEKMAMEGIVWKFNPPGAPHFGGAWESLVKSCKRAIYNVLGNQAMTEELLCTIICVVEQLINNRPLTAVSDDVKDLEVLTPNHFLIGSASVAWPNALFGENGNNLRRSFRARGEYLRSIWERWMHEYLPSLQKRQKWFKDNEKSVAVGDIVWLIEKRVSGFNYPMARVLELYCGDDGVARAARIKTAKGDMVRPVVKLVPLHSDRN